MAEIARLADVSTRTFFSYFETKEDVFLTRADQRFERLAGLIRERDCGQPLMTALRGDLQGDRKANETTQSNLAGLLRHPAIRARLRERWNGWEDMIAEAIAEEVGAAPADPEPRVVAAALTGAIRVAAAAAEEQPSRRREIAKRGFDLLAGGLADYGAKKSGRAHRMGKP